MCAYLVIDLIILADITEGHAAKMGDPRRKNKISWHIVQKQTIWHERPKTTIHNIQAQQERHTTHEINLDEEAPFLQSAHPEDVLHKMSVRKTRHRDS